MRLKFCHHRTNQPTNEQGDSRSRIYIYIYIAVTYADIQYYCSRRQHCRPPIHNKKQEPKELWLWDELACLYYCIKHNMQVALFRLKTALTEAFYNTNLNPIFRENDHFPRLSQTFYNTNFISIFRDNNHFPRLSQRPGLVPVETQHQLIGEYWGGALCWSASCIWILFVFVFVFLFVIVFVLVFAHICIYISK